MTLDELKAISRVQLDIMDEIHRVCVQNDICYYMIGGTLLGAVRHRGFIPWDLDMDIAMPRKDYIRFKELCGTKLGSQYRYVDYHDFRSYISPHALIVNTKTRIQTKYDAVNPKLVDLGVYIDIFPLDNAPDDEKLRKKQAKKLYAIRKVKSRRIVYCYSFIRWRRIIHRFLAALLFWVSVPKLNRYQQQQMQKYNNQDTECICSMASQYKYAKQCMPREVYGVPVLLEFEGRQYYAPAKYTDYLTRLYGDYMQLPPEEQRQANLSFFRSVEFL